MKTTFVTLIWFFHLRKHVHFSFFFSLFLSFFALNWRMDNEWCRAKIHVIINNFICGVFEQHIFTKSLLRAHHQHLLPEVICFFSSLSSSIFGLGFNGDNNLWLTTTISMLRQMISFSTKKFFFLFSLVITLAFLLTIFSCHWHVDFE